MFSINDSGVVTVNGDLLNGHFGEHRMTVIATDHGDPPLETRVNLIINVENVLQSVSANSVSFIICYQILCCENHKPLRSKSEFTIFSSDREKDSNN